VDGPREISDPYCKNDGVYHEHLRKMILWDYKPIERNTINSLAENQQGKNRLWQFQNTPNNSDIDRGNSFITSVILFL
jgi:hypothetical protein